MKAMRVNLSLPGDVAETLKRRAAEESMPVSRYVSDLISGDAKRHRDALAAAGYKELSASAREFAKQAGPLAAESWPTWEQ